MILLFSENILYNILFLWNPYFKLDVPLSHHHLLKSKSFLLWTTSVTLLNISSSYVYRFISAFCFPVPLICMLIFVSILSNYNSQNQVVCVLQLCSYLRISVSVCQIPLLIHINFYKACSDFDWDHIELKDQFRESCPDQYCAFWSKELEYW